VISSGLTKAAWQIALFQTPSVASREDEPFDECLPFRCCEETLRGGALQMRVFVFYNINAFGSA
jgi:hypothetical protein